MSHDLKKIIDQKILENTSIKLHIGCGPVIFPDWINIDGEYMKDHPDIALHDITKPYPIPDNSVDEILSIHVIEHIMPNEIEETLKEWLRILKPGGKVAIEWPDLLKMCTFIVNNPACLYSEKPKILKRSVAGIFGNIGKYRDVAMLHKWGYSADSLSHILKKYGFKETVIEKNLYPKTDMCSRVVGIK